MTTSRAVPVQRRPGGRSSRVQAAVFAATLEALREAGYDALSIAAVAARAGVHETSIYRRWRTKPALVLDAMLAVAADAIPTPDTGELRADLVALLRAVVAFMWSPEGTAGVQLAVGAVGDAEMATLLRAYWADRFGRAEAIVRRGVERGDLPPEINPRLFLEMLVGVAYVRLFLAGETVDDATIAEIVTFLLHGAMTGYRTTR